MEPAQVAVLFVKRRSVYKTLPGTDCYDDQRDARNYAGGLPVVAHPPCRTWGRLKAFARAPAGEHELAIWAVGQVRRWGGVLEHPERSDLWWTIPLPIPGGLPDNWGGFTIEVDQFHWGHSARKRTWLYIVGCDIDALPVKPVRQGEPSHVIKTSSKDKGKRKPYCPHGERAATPPEFAGWLVDVARRCRAKAVQ